MLHWFIYLEAKCIRLELVKDIQFPLKLLLFIALFWIVEEFWVQVIHDEIAYFHHIKVDFIFISEQIIFLQLMSQHLKELIKQVSQAAEVQIVLLEEFVANGRSS